MTLADLPIELTAPPPVDVPGLAALRAGGTERSAFLKYHLSDRVSGIAQTLTYHALAPLPGTVAARIGAPLGALTLRADRDRPYVEYMRRGISLIRPELAGDRAGQDRVLAAWFRNAGITHAQFACLPGIVRRSGLRLEGREHFEAARATGRPVFLVSVHLGNWEAIGYAAREVGLVDAFGIYEPQPNRFQNRLLYRRRVREGQYVFPPSRRLPVLLERLVVEKGAGAGLFLDEVRDGASSFPYFGRQVRASSNMRFVLRLAGRTGALLVPSYLLREGRAGMVCRMLPALPPQPARPDADGLERSARHLSAIFEPIVRENLEQWYMLQSMRLPPPGDRAPGAGRREAAHQPCGRAAD